MSIRGRMAKAFQSVNGGLFCDNAGKADVGDVLTEFRRQGVDLMAWADPFFPDLVLPEHVARAAAQAYESGAAVHYSPPVGNARLKEAIAVKLKAYNGLDVAPQRNIMITPGSDSGLFFAMMPFLAPGDEVLMSSPSYPSNFLNPALVNAVTVPVIAREENGFHLDMAEWERQISPASKMVLLTHPNNPTGTVYRREELEELARFVIRHDLVLVVDQAFEDFIYDGLEFVTPAALPGMWERTVTVCSISKGMGLSGFRLGYIVACDEVMDVFYGTAVNVVGASNSAAQLAAIEAFRDSSFLAEYKCIFERRRHMVHEVLNAVPGVSMALPESGFLSWVNVSALGDSADVADYLIRRARVAVNDSAPYGPGGEGHLRIVHGCFRDEQHLREVLYRVRDALLELAKQKGLA